MPKRLVVQLAAISIAVVAGACSEDFTGGATCPVLCPESGFEIINDTIDAAVALDSTVRGFPLPGDENQLTLLQRFGNGDTVITAGVVRFDFIPKTVPVGTDSALVAKVDSAELRLSVVSAELDPLSRRDTIKRVPVTIEVYDVDTAATDFDTAAVRARFRPGTLIGSYTVRRDSLPDSVFVQLDTAIVRARVQAGRLRVGLRIRSDSSMQVPLAAVNFLRFKARAGADSIVRTVLPASGSTSEGGGLPRLDRYLIVLRGTPPPPPQILAVGGLPAQRAYIRLSLPSNLVDSVTVVRAALVLTQAPVRGRTEDTVRIAVQATVSIANAQIDVGRASLLVRARPGLFEQRRAPSDSGLVRFELAGAIPIWRLDPVDEIPRAVVLRSAEEAEFPSEFYFYSSEAPANLRPRIEISYIPRVDFSLP
ncbi:MAG TPA: hypothetical protein VJ650_17970 [Gemmatimonadaceae bacterium]|nr:hypothetical protein [Gemmatimonadaceae bacterium]